MRSVRSIRMTLALSLFILFVMSAGAAIATTIYVDSTAGGSNNGTSWGNAYTSLQSALGAATNGDEIRVAAGTYKPHASTRSVSFVIPAGVDVLGGYPTGGGTRNPASNVTILSGDLSENDSAVSCTCSPAAPICWDSECSGNSDVCANGYCLELSNSGENSYHVVVTSAMGAGDVLDGFTIQRGRADGSSGSGYHRGSAIENIDGTGTLRNLIINENWSSDHAAVDDHGGMTLESCSFSRNYSDDKAGAFWVQGHNTSEETISASLSGCSFQYNAAPDGGALWNQGDLDISFSTFEDNFAITGFGGAIYNDHVNDEAGAIVRICATSFERNIGFNIAGVAYEIDSETHYDNCRFIENQAPGDGEFTFGTGGAFYLATADATFTNCVFSQNYSPAAGGLVLISSSTADFVNCTLSLNESDGSSSGGLMSVASGSTATLTNSILWHNNDTGTSDHFAGAGSITVSYSCVDDSSLEGAVSNGGNNVFSCAPEFVDDANHNLMIDCDDPDRSGTPIDVGNNGATFPDDWCDLDGDSNTGESLPTDIRDGYDPCSPTPCEALTERIEDGDDNASEVMDMGAYECQSDE